MFSLRFYAPHSMEEDMYKDIRKKFIRERWRSHRGGYWNREKGSWRYIFERENCQFKWTGEIQFGQLADDESREDFVFENGKERKRNPRKERSRRKCLIHSILMARTRKVLHYVISEEEST
jgi:hypothetical protein